MNNTNPSPVKSEFHDPESPVYNYNVWRENYIVTILRIACVLSIGLVIVSFQSAPLRDKIIFPTFILILLGVTFLRTPYYVRAYTLLFLTFAVGINGIITLGTWTDSSVFLLIFVILASLLFDTRINIYGLGISFVTLVILAILNLIGWFRPVSPLTPVITATDWAIFIADFTLGSILAIFAIGQLKQEFGNVILQVQNTFKSLVAERSQLEDKVRDRTDELEVKNSQLQASAAIARSIAQVQNIPDLLNTAVTATANEFGYYHVGIYLLDSNKKVAFLQAASSEIGRELIGSGHHVDVDIRNPINLVIEKNRPYSASDTGGSLFIKDPNFPITRSRFAIPLSVRDNIIGVLDMHSNQIQTLDSQSIEIIQTLADLIAISIDNVRLLDETQTLVEQLKFYNTAEAIETWSTQTSRRSPAYQYTPAGVRPIFSQVKKDETASGTLSIPLTLQGQKIGAIKLRRKGFSSTWSEKEKGMIEKISEQISLALENSRLVDEAQKNAHRDQLIANISARVRETLDVDAVIRTASLELRKVFDLKEAEISIGLPQSEPRPIRKNTSTLRLK